MPQLDSFIQSLQKFWITLSQTLPGLLAAVVLLLVGWIVARLVERFLVRLLKFLRFDKLAEKTGVEDFLLQGGVRFTAVTLVGRLVYWMILLTVTLAVLNSLGIESAAALFGQVINFLPRFIVALIVVMFGGLLAKFAHATTYTYLSNIGLSGAWILSLLTKYAILLFIAFLALEQLAIESKILVSAFQIAFGALCLGLALAFGLGGRDWAASVLDRIRKRGE